MSNPIKHESFSTHFMVPIDVSFHSHDFRSVEEWEAFKTKMTNDPEYRKKQLMKMLDDIYENCKDGVDDIVDSVARAINDGQDNGFDLVVH